MAKKNHGGIVCDRYGHVENLNERIDFLYFVMKNAPNSYKLPIKYMYQLWAMLYENPVSPADSQAMFAFLKAVAADQSCVRIIMLAFSL